MKKSVSSWRERSRKMLQFNRSAPEFEIYCGSELLTYTGLQIFSQFAASKLCFFLKERLAGMMTNRRITLTFYE